jgi:hypothetical protein
MIDLNEAEDLARGWINAWNVHSAPALTTFYSDDFEMTAPHLFKKIGFPEGMIRGKENLASAFEKAFEIYPDLKFEFIEVSTGVNSMVVDYRGLEGVYTSDLWELNERGEIERSAAHYKSRR